jgi:hypothetical protein
MESLTPCSREPGVANTQPQKRVEQGQQLFPNIVSNTLGLAPIVQTLLWLRQHEEIKRSAVGHEMRFGSVYMIHESGVRTEDAREPRRCRIQRIQRNSTCP